MGDDDLLRPGALARLGEVIGKHGNLGVILRAYEHVNFETGERMEIFQYFDSDRFFPAGADTIRTFFRRSVSIAGFTIHTATARALATPRFDGTLLYQLHLSANVLATRDGYYVSDVLTSMRKDSRQRHFFGSAEAERGRFAPTALTPEHSVNFMRGMFEIARATEERLGLGVYPGLVADIGNYSYAFLKLHAKNRRVFAGYVRELARLGLWKNAYFWGYSGALMVLPPRVLDRGIGLIKKMLPATPRLGKVYAGRGSRDAVLATLVSCMALPACMCGPGSGESSGTTAGTGQSIGGRTTGRGASSIGASSGGAPSSGASSGGASSSGTGSGSGTTSGSTGTPQPCAPGRVWIGDLCAAADCSQVPLESACDLGEGRFGLCEGGNQCVQDTTDDPYNNCGAYGIACPLNGGCTRIGSGFCTVGTGFSSVDCSIAECPTGKACVQQVGCLDPCELQTEGEACVLDAGIAFPFGPVRLGACCGYSCLNPSTDPANCGNCGIVCGPGTVCERGQCLPAVACGPTDNNLPCLADGGAAGLCCYGGCVDAESDPGNCGGCGVTCPSTSACNGRTCTNNGGGCPAGTAYVFESCAPFDCGPNSLGTACHLDGGLNQAACCAAGCIDVTSDPQNCGGCGQSCGPGAICNAGNCWTVADCATSLSPFDYCVLPGNVDALGECCGGTCASTEGDDSNCGSCGIVCPQGSYCFDASCVFDGGLRASCDGGAACPAGTECAQGDCLAPCGPGSFGETCPIAGHAGSCCGSTCVDVLGDSQNCGHCGNACPGGGCSSGQCQTPCGPGVACPSGYVCATSDGYPIGPCLPVDCTGLPRGEACDFGGGASGYCCGDSCIDRQQDPRNCGACGNVCPSGICTDGQCFEPNPSTQCAQTCPPQSVCTPDGCVSSECPVVTEYSPGTISYYERCLASDGTVGVCCPFIGECAHLADDPQNCGICGVVCPAGQTCAGGACSGSPDCSPGHIGGLCAPDAGLNHACCPGAGCTDLESDPNNCTACGYVCPEQMSCVAGTCQ